MLPNDPVKRGSCCTFYWMLLKKLLKKFSFKKKSLFSRFFVFFFFFERLKLGQFSKISSSVTHIFSIETLSHNNKKKALILPLVMVVLLITPLCQGKKQKVAQH